MGKKNILEITSEVNRLRNELEKHRRRNMQGMEKMPMEAESGEAFAMDREMTPMESIVNDVIRSHRDVYGTISRLAQRMRFSEEEGITLNHASEQIPKTLRLLEMMPGAAEVVAEIEKEVKEQLNRDRAKLVVDG